MNAPLTGRTVEAHAALMMADVEVCIAEAFATIRQPRMRPAEREAVSRLLAGVISHCYSIRYWVEAGARR